MNYPMVLPDWLPFRKEKEAEQPDRRQPGADRRRGDRRSSSRERLDHATTQTVEATDRNKATRQSLDKVLTEIIDGEAWEDDRT